MTLMPLSSDIPDAARNLSTELRRFFGTLDISVRRYAARHNYDPATVSRYLNGRRVPPWPFIQNLLTEVSENFGTPIQQDAYEIVRRLHRLALEASNKNLYQVQVLQDRLAEADKEHKLAELREKTLLEAMQLRQHRISQLTSDNLEINSSLLEEREKSKRLEGELLQLLPDADELSRLRDEVRELKEQLNRAHELSEQAEARCQELEEQLQAAEEVAQAGREAREQEELQAALQEAAEAKAQADELRELLERIKEEASPLQPTVVTMTPKRRTESAIRKKTFRERFAHKPVSEIASSLVKLDLSEDSAESHTASRDIAINYPVSKVGDLIVETSRLSEGLARALLMGFGDNRSPEEAISLIRDFGTEIVDRRSNLASQVVLWFAWERPAPDIFRLVALLREEGWNELATGCLASAAQHQQPGPLVELINRASPSDRKELIAFTASSRTPEKIVPLVARMREPKYVEIASELIEMIESQYPSKFMHVSSLLDAIGGLID